MDKHKEKIMFWINTFIKPIRSNNYCYDHSSYSLKHYCERMIGEYVSNDEMKECMLEAGYLPSNAKKLNWHFALSTSELNWLKKFSFKLEGYFKTLKNIDDEKSDK